MCICLVLLTQVYHDEGFRKREVNKLFCSCVYVTTEGKRLLGRPRLRLEDNNKMDLQDVEGGV
jgi:hypothetical protein